jgi:hypothetical protein
MSKNLLLTLGLVCLAITAFTTYTPAQTAPLPPGGVTLGTFSTSNCTDGGWAPGMSCANGTVICDISLGVADLGFTLGYAVPSGSNLGTVVAFSGGGGTSPATATGGEVQALEYYLANGLEAVQVKWNSDWEGAQFAYSPSEPYGNILNAACRPAGILYAVRNTPLLFNPGGGMCAQGFSAGSAAVAYSLRGMEQDGDRPASLTTWNCYQDPCSAGLTMVARFRRSYPA